MSVKARLWICLLFWGAGSCSMKQVCYYVPIELPDGGARVIVDK